jgi:hypothetical protein
MFVIAQGLFHGTSDQLFFWVDWSKNLNHGYEEVCVVPFASYDVQTCGVASM